MQEWLKHHEACHVSYMWAINNVETLDQLWKHAPDPEWVVWMATRPGVLTRPTLVRFIWAAIFDAAPKLSQGFQTFFQAASQFRANRIDVLEFKEALDAAERRLGEREKGIASRLGDILRQPDVNVAYNAIAISTALVNLDKGLAQKQADWLRRLDSLNWEIPK